MRQVHLTKRDGSSEPFEPAKLQHCLVAALRSCGRPEHLASALVRAVALHLARERGRHTTEYVYRCIRTALLDVGLTDVAERITLHRRQRAARRRAVGICDPQRPGRAPLPWRKSWVVSVLQHRYELRRPVARILAGQIEQRILDLEYTVISSRLLEEVMRTELMAWGLLDGADGCSTGPAGPAPTRGVSDERT